MSRARWLRRALLPRLVALALGALATALVPAWWCGREARGWYDGELETRREIADSVAQFATSQAGQATFHTGSARFDGEWALVTCQMTVLSLTALILDHPEERARWLPAVEACLEWMLRPEALAFGDAAWPGDPGPHAYHGYLAVALGAHRQVAPDSRFAPAHDRLIEGLVRRMAKEPPHALATYPGESYPADLATVAAAVALHDQVTDADHAEVLRRWLGEYEATSVDPDTGLLHQSLDPATGRPMDQPRASGTAFSVYFLAYADVPLSRRLYEALDRQCADEVLGFGVTDEYPPGAAGGFGDVDSGPVVMGIGPSATAFSVAAARTHGRWPRFKALVAGATLIGAPFPVAGGRRWATGGPLGNALLLAMLTAPRREVSP